MGFVIGAVVAALVAAAVIGARYVKHPEQTAGHGEVSGDTTSDRLYGGTDRPAGPDVEDGPGTP